jgi:beta-galactosidase
VQLQVGRTDGPALAPADAATGGSVDIDADGRLRHPLLATPPTLSLWRAPTDNDRIGGFAARWESQGVDRLERRPGSVERDGASTTVHDTFRAGSIEIAHEATYTCRADGAIEVVETVDIPDALVDLARVGTVMEVAAGPESLRWFGTGPHETYPDRKRSGLVGRWESTVADQYVPYIRPQENGGHADVRWLELRDGAGAALRIVLDQPRQVSVTHYRAQDLATATHDIDVVAVPETVIHIDAAHRGLGTASCGPDTTPEYLLGAGRYTWAWTLRDLAPA